MAVQRLFQTINFAAINNVLYFFLKSITNYVRFLIVNKFIFRIDSLSVYNDLITRKIVYLKTQALY